MTVRSPHLTLNNGVLMPALGLGVGAVESSPGQAAAAVETALNIGYRLVDTAAVYGNEHEVADGIQRSGVLRSEIFLTTKLWIDDYGFDRALRGFEASLHRLRTDYVDLYLLHQPLPTEFNATAAAYRAAEKLLVDGRVRAIRMSNASERHLNELAGLTEITPAVNQVELHPYFSQSALRTAHAAAGTTTQAWSPIGGVISWRPDPQRTSSPLSDPVVRRIAGELGKTPAQILLGWHLRQGRSAIPKSFTPGRIEENFDIFDVELSAEHVDAIDGLDTGRRSGRDPESVTRSAK